MGHMDSSDEPRFTVTVRWHHGDGNPEVFQHATSVDTNGDEVSFVDSNEKHHDFSGVSYHVASE